jgi:phosphate/sulfate permease
MLTSILFISVCFLAYANGANDNFKGVASLFGNCIHCVILVVDSAMRGYLFRCNLVHCGWRYP